MSNSNEHSLADHSVIRLKVDGANSVVNTLKDQQTGRGLSLVCPFPALEVNIPVRFVEGDDTENTGKIHRIGVEDDPETGLPKLRLSIRKDDGRETIIRTPSRSLIDEASRMTVAPDATAQTDPDIDTTTCDLGDLLDDVLDDDKDFDTGLLSLEDMTLEDDPICNHSDPEWANCEELIPLDQLGPSAKTRRRRRAIGVAAWMMVLGIATGGIYALGKAGVVDLSTATTFVSKLFADEKPTELNDTLESFEKSVQDNQDSVEQVVSLENESPVPEQIDVDGANDTIPSSITQVAEVAPENVQIEEAVALTEETAEALEESEPLKEDMGEVDSNLDEAIVVLPTRWPAEYASAYRLRDPNGVVVDVPGGLVKREGWLEIADEFPMIRSIKAVQRESGARFVVFVNGELPRFMTSPKTGGIALRLYRDKSQFPGETEQVAMLE